MTELKIVERPDAIWDLLRVVWPERSEEWLGKQKKAASGTQWVEVCLFPSLVGAMVSIDFNVLKIIARYWDDNLGMLVSEFTAMIDQRPSMVPYAGCVADSDAVKAMVERVANQASAARQRWEEGEKLLQLHTLELTPGEYRLLNGGRCSCGHLFALHNSHCCNFCEVPGCTCEDE